jgi:hypothetical protein
MNSATNATPVTVYLPFDRKRPQDYYGAPPALRNCATARSTSAGGLA